MTPLHVYVTYPPEPDLPALHDRLGDLAGAVELRAGSGYLDPDAVRTRKRGGTFVGGDGSGEPPLSDEDVAAYAWADVIVALDVPWRLAELTPRLRWIQTIGAGVGQYREEQLAERGVVLSMAAGVGAPPIAEFVIGRLLEHYKRFRELAALQREHRWAYTPGGNLGGRTMVIVGLGAIGREVAVRARAFGVRTVGVRRSYEPGMTSPLVDELCGPDGLDDVLPTADIVVLSAPETAETRGLFDAARFARMKPGAVLCNVARGSLVDQAALLEALASGQLAAALLDVVEPEPLPPDDPLWDAAGVVLSPHTSTSTEGYNDRLFDLVAANIRRYLRDEPLANLVDLTGVGVR
ncbi:MAG TPA: D-2-hydroxyacid dehydrogenase [Acidimicrobiales bacterium]|nr:D-2-hydroxyacid dehydrogenase [Acidimicrobiales bacterium]